MASGLVTSIGSGCSLASATSSSGTATLTAKTAGAAGNFITEFGTATEFNNFYVYITNTTKGQGPNYVSGITITTAGSGYAPDTPITLSGEHQHWNRAIDLPAGLWRRAWLRPGNGSGQRERL
jgi:hypothetical protein